MDMLQELFEGWTSRPRAKERDLSCQFATGAIVYVSFKCPVFKCLVLERRTKLLLKTTRFCKRWLLHILMYIMITAIR
jgi:hypothetical protein